MGGDWSLAFLDLNSFPLIPQFSNPTGYFPLCRGEEPCGQEDHKIRAACWCHHQHGRHRTLWSRGGCVHCTAEWLGLERWANHHHQVRHGLILTCITAAWTASSKHAPGRQTKKDPRWGVLLVSKFHLEDKGYTHGTRNSCFRIWEAEASLCSA